jgi:hypothetical protein
MEQVFYTTPDGVKREIRFTFGGLKRIVQRLHCQIGEAVGRYGEAAFPEILYCFMYDRKGQPPAGLDPDAFMEEVDPASHLEIWAKIEAACPPSPTKNVLREGLQQARAIHARFDWTLTDAGASPFNDLESPMQSSGNSPSENSIASASDGLTNGKSKDFTPA